MSEPKSKASPQHSDLPEHLRPPDPRYDWRPEHLHGTPQNGGSPMCGCRMHYGQNFQEWLFCKTHVQAVNSHEVAREMANLIMELPDTGYVSSGLQEVARKFQEMDK